MTSLSTTWRLDLMAGFLLAQVSACVVARPHNRVVSSAFIAPNTNVTVLAPVWGEASRVCLGANFKIRELRTAVDRARAKAQDAEALVNVTVYEDLIVAPPSPLSECRTTVVGTAVDVVTGQKRLDANAEPRRQAAPTQVQRPLWASDPPPRKRRERPMLRHGFGIRGGFAAIPSVLVAQFYRYHTNSLCRGSTIGAFGQSLGLTRKGGCSGNFALEYIHRYSERIDLVVSSGWQSFDIPDGYWLAQGEALSATNYVEIDLSFWFIQFESHVRESWQIANHVELQLGIGGVVGVGVGTVRGRAVEHRIEGCGGEDEVMFRECLPTSTISTDQPVLQRVPPILPNLGLLVSSRLLLSRRVGIQAAAGWLTGLYFHTGVQVFFGGKTR